MKLKARPARPSSRILIASLFLIIAPLPSLAMQSSSGSSQRFHEVKDDDIVSDEVMRYMREADHLARLRQFDQAIAAYESAEHAAGRPVFSIYLGLGAVYYEKKDFKSAAEAQRQASAVRPNDSRPHFNLAESLYNLGDFAGAETEYRKAIALAPPQFDTAEAHHFLGLSLYGQKRLDDAIAEYKLAIDLRKGNYSDAHYNLGIAYMDRGENKLSESEFRTAIQQDYGLVPQDHFNLAVLLEKEKKSAEAADEYEKYLRLAPDADDQAALRARIARLRKAK